MIWRYGQYLPVALFTVGAAIVSTSITWETALRGSWWLPAIGLCLLALGVEVLKPVAVANRMWWFAIPCVLVSGFAEFQAVARGRAGYADTKAVATKDHAADTVSNLRKQLDETKPARASSELRPLVEAAERAAGDCPAKMGPAQRDACRALPQLKSEAARAILIEDLRAKIAAGVEKKLEVRGASEEADALAMIAGWLGVPADGANVDRLMALLLIALFQAASVGSAVVVRGAPAVPASDLSFPEKPINTGPGHEATAVPVVAISGPDPDHELLLSFLSGKGGLYVGSQRSLASVLGWGRNKYDRVIREAREAGTVRVSAQGIELIEQKETT